MINFIVAETLFRVDMYWASEQQNMLINRVLIVNIEEGQRHCWFMDSKGASRYIYYALAIELIEQTERMAVNVFAISIVFSIYTDLKVFNQFPFSPHS